MFSVTRALTDGLELADILRITSVDDRLFVNHKHALAEIAIDDSQAESIAAEAITVLAELGGQDAIEALQKIQKTSLSKDKKAAAGNALGKLAHGQQHNTLTSKKSE